MNKIKGFREKSIKFVASKTGCIDFNYLFIKFKFRRLNVVTANQSLAIFAIAGNSGLERSFFVNSFFVGHSLNSELERVW